MRLEGTRDEPLTDTDKFNFERLVLDHIEKGEKMYDGGGFMQGISGLDEPGRMFSPDNKPQFVIITPVHTGPDTIIYHDEVLEIEQLLYMMLPESVTGSVWPYLPVMDAETRDRTSNGKAYFQYDPRQKPEIPPDADDQEAAYEVWLEDRYVDSGSLTSREESCTDLIQGQCQS